MELTTSDPKGLIRESYRIEGITPGECRSVFMDWALSLPNILCVGGSWVAPKDAMARKDWAAITTLAQEARSLR